MGVAERLASAPCQRADDDGIAYYDCGTYRRSLYHDANKQALLPERERLYRSRSAGCHGGCGTSCATTNGYMTFSYDCGEHDPCGRVHGGSTNPWDGECGDEYWDADDDFLWGWKNSLAWN